MMIKFTTDSILNPAPDAGPGAITKVEEEIMPDDEKEQKAEKEIEFGTERPDSFQVTNSDDGTEKPRQ